MRRPNLAFVSASVCQTKRKPLVVLWWQGTGPAIFPDSSRLHPHPEIPVMRHALVLSAVPAADKTIPPTGVR